MKETYNTEDLFVANLQRTSIGKDYFLPIIETTNQQYIFEKTVIGNNVNYREIFTGFTTKDANDTVENGCSFKHFDLPYVYEPQPFTDYFPETIGITIPKLSLI